MGYSRLTVGNRPELILKDTHLTVKTVCDVCNNGWMNDLEGEIIPILSPMFEDQTVTLDFEQQNILSVWVAKMALLLDSTSGRNMASRFYTKEEAVALRVRRELPPFTKVWIGRLDKVGRAITGTRFNTTTDRAKLNGCATTMTNEHFVAQIVSMHLEPFPEGPATIQLEMAPGDWDLALSTIWPGKQPGIGWPPQHSFTNEGSAAYCLLLERWRLGARTKPASP
jgi:hypothetical protein